MPDIVRSLDGRDLSGVPWEKGTPNEPVFVEEFVEYDDVPYVVANSGLFRMLPNKASSLGYTLELAFDAPTADILFKGSTIPESEAVALLSSPVEA